MFENRTDCVSEDVKTNAAVGKLAPRFVQNRHPVERKWFLYRVSSRGGSPGDDVLVKEWALQGPKGEPRTPGPWLIEKMKNTDSWKVAGRSGASKFFMDRMEELEALKIEERNDNERELVLQAAKNLFEHSVLNKRHFTQRAKGSRPIPVGTKRIVIPQ